MADHLHAIAALDVTGSPDDPLFAVTADDPSWILNAKNPKGTNKRGNGKKPKTKNKKKPPAPSTLCTMLSPKAYARGSSSSTSSTSQVDTKPKSSNQFSALHDDDDGQDSQRQDFQEAKFDY